MASLSMVSERPLLLTPPWPFSTTLLYILEFVSVPTLRQIDTGSPKELNQLRGMKASPYLA
jgi:hypothetical protein